MWRESVPLCRNHHRPPLNTGWPRPAQSKQTSIRKPRSSGRCPTRGRQESEWPCSSGRVRPSHIPRRTCRRFGPLFSASALSALRFISAKNTGPTAAASRIRSNKCACRWAWNPGSRSCVKWQILHGRNPSQLRHTEIEHEKRSFSGVVGKGKYLAPVVSTDAARGIPCSPRKCAARHCTQGRPTHPDRLQPHPE